MACRSRTELPWLITGGDQAPAAPVEERVGEDVLPDAVVEALHDHGQGRQAVAPEPLGGTGSAGREPPAGDRGPAAPARADEGLGAVILDAVVGVPDEHVHVAG